MEPQTNWCCLATQSEIQYRKLGDMILYYKRDADLRCLTGWTGSNCDACALNFGPPGKCNRCLIGWAGENCDTCARGWTGENCTECATNFRPAGQCDLCLTGWAGENCDVCGFGFSTESGCSECIQRDVWNGDWLHQGGRWTLMLTFDGPSCNNVVPGMHQIHLFHYFTCISMARREVCDSH